MLKGNGILPPCICPRAILPLDISGDFVNDGDGAQPDPANYNVSVRKLAEGVIDRPAFAGENVGEDSVNLRVQMLEVLPFPYHLAGRVDF